LTENNALVEKYREQLVEQLKDTLSTLVDLDRAEPRTVILDVEDLIGLARKFLKKYEQMFPLPDGEG